MNVKVIANVTSLCRRLVKAIGHVPHIEIGILDAFFTQRGYCHTRRALGNVVRGGSAETRATPLVERGWGIAIPHGRHGSVHGSVGRTWGNLGHAVVYRRGGFW